jgi:zinc protease
MTRSTEPRALADDSAARWIFADGATYGRTLLGDEATVDSFTAAECRAFHERRFSPHGSAVIVVGAVTADDAEREVRRAFGDWTGGQERQPAPSTEPRHDRTTVHVIDRASAVQSELRIGHVGVPRDHRDYYALLVMNAIAGGAFTSRLNLNLREKNGFTYGVRSSFAFRRAAEPFVIQTAVASDVTARAVAETLKELRALQEGGVADEEVRNARDFIAGTLPLQLQTTDQIAARIADLHTYDLPDDHLENYGEHVRAVSSEDVVRVAREHLRLDQLAVVVVGNAAAVIEDLRALGIGDVVHHNGDVHPNGGVDHGLGTGAGRAVS